eukprot:scaffold143425_cov530-Phaeocystis_antarctica.AAC.1
MRTACPRSSGVDTEPSFHARGCRTFARLTARTRTTSAVMSTSTSQWTSHAASHRAAVTDSSTAASGAPG